MSVEVERIPTDPRLSRRRRAVARARRRRTYVRGALLATLIGALWTAFWSPLLEVRRVEVVGGKHTTARHVAAAAGLVGDNLLLLSTSEVARRVSSLAWVRRASVTRMLPGTVRVRVAERRPAVVLAARDERWTLDARGRVLMAGRARGGLPTLVAGRARGARPGEVVDDTAARAALTAFRSLRPRLHRRVVALFAPSAERIGFSLAAGPLVRFGAAERLADKNAVLDALLERIRRAGLSAAYVDVRVPESPALGPPAGGAPSRSAEGRSAP
jgi:cell division protein FtsQ